MKRGDKIRNQKGQVTIFAIIAILIIAVLFIIFYPQLKKLVIPPAPEEMIPRECFEKAVKEAINITMNHGGRVNPLLYFKYNSEPIAYVCYTSEWYKTCTMQIPMIKQSVEAESQVYSQKKIDACFSEMEDNFRNKGYVITLTGSKKPVISLEPKKVVIRFNISAAVNKNELTQTFESNKFSIIYNSNVYDIIMIASSIQNFEARYGDTIIDNYMAYYPNIKVEKMRQSDGTKVYVLTDRDTKEKLQFAIRSLSWPPGWAAP